MKTLEDYVREIIKEGVEKRFYDPDCDACKNTINWKTKKAMKKVAEFATKITEHEQREALEEPEKEE